MGNIGNGDHCSTNPEYFIVWFPPNEMSQRHGFTPEVLRLYGTILA